MKNQMTLRIKFLITGIVTFFILGMLLWEHFHGGVMRHHILNNDDLPAISNWWGALLLPALTWFLMGRINKRYEKQNPGHQEKGVQKSADIRLFIAGLVIGILIATSFMHDYTPFLDNVVYLLLIMGLFVPIFYAEFILGFILGMTYTFGAILPTAFILIISSIGALLYIFIRPAIINLIRKISNKTIKAGNE